MRYRILNFFQKSAVNCHGRFSGFGVVCHTWVKKVEEESREGSEGCEGGTACDGFNAKWETCEKANENAKIKPD